MKKFALLLLSLTLCFALAACGGSDTSAVALAAALRADKGPIYTDVDGRRHRRQHDRG